MKKRPSSRTGTGAGLKNRKDVGLNPTSAKKVYVKNSANKFSRYKRSGGNNLYFDDMLKGMFG